MDDEHAEHLKGRSLLDPFSQVGLRAGIRRASLWVVESQ